MQSQSSGPLYLFKYAGPSLLDCTFNDDYWHHTKHWSEQNANIRACNYFTSKDSNFKDWNWYLNPIYDSNGNSTKSTYLES